MFAKWAKQLKPRWTFSIIPPWLIKDEFERQVAQDLIDCDRIGLKPEDFDSGV